MCLDLNREKTVCMIMGSRKQRKKQAGDVKQGVGNLWWKKKKFTSGWANICHGLADSVAETVGMREGKVRGACLEIVQIVNDWRSHLAGGMVNAITLWERCCVPSLLHGAGTWTDISPEPIRGLARYWPHMAATRLHVLDIWKYIIFF